MNIGPVITTLQALNEAAGRNDLGSPTILTFLVVAEAGGSLPQSQLKKRVGLTGAGISRSLTRLGDGSSKIVGLGLLKADFDPMDRRYRIVSLTAAGIALVAAIYKKAGTA